MAKAVSQGAQLSAAFEKEDQAGIKRAAKQQWGLPEGEYDIVISKDTARLEQVGDKGWTLKINGVVAKAYKKAEGNGELVLLVDEKTGAAKRAGLQHAETFFLQSKAQSGEYRGLNNAVKHMMAVNSWLPTPVWKDQKELEKQLAEPGKQGLPFEAYCKAVNAASANNLTVRLSVSKSMGSDGVTEFTNANWRFKPRDKNAKPPGAPPSPPTTTTSEPAWEQDDAADKAGERPPVGHSVRFSSESKLAGTEGVVFQYKENGDCIVKKTDDGKNVKVAAADIATKLDWEAEVAEEMEEA